MFDFWRSEMFKFQVFLAEIDSSSFSINDPLALLFHLQK